VKILLVGGSGFLGKHVLSLIKDEFNVILFSRKALDGFNIIYGDIRRESDVKRVGKVDIVINLAGVLKGDYFGVHVKGVRNLLTLAPRIIHVSALWSSPTGNQYQVSKWEGERLVMKFAESYFIVRPSVMFGISDRFITRLLKYVRRFTFIPWFDGKVSPVFVGDVAEVIVNAIDSVKKGDKQIKSICGPRDFTIKELMKLLADIFGIKKRFLKIPKTLLHIYSRFSDFPLFTEMLKTKECERLKTDVEDYVRRHVHEFT